MGGLLPDKRCDWRWAAASQIGTSHLRTELPCQDAYAVRRLKNDGLFAIVADGAGSAEFGKQAAWMLCRLLSGHVQRWFQENCDLPSDDEIWSWIDNFRDRIALIARARAVAPRQFACTLAALICNPIGVIGLQVGDSAAVGRNGGAWESLIWPENGEYASSTFFVTDEPEPRLNILRKSAEYDAFALFSDGIGDIALEVIEQRPFAKFFDPMIAPIDAARHPGKLADLSTALGIYLDSPAICERTDDDKTLILFSAV